MTKTTFNCCDPIDAVAAEDRPPRCESLTKAWRCPKCGRRWKVTVWFDQDGNFTSGEATPRAFQFQNWRDNWPLAIPGLIAVVFSLVLWVL